MLQLGTFAELEWSLPASSQLRARGRTSGGNYNGSSGMVQQVADFSLASIALTVTPSRVQPINGVHSSLEQHWTCQLQWPCNGLLYQHLDANHGISDLGFIAGTDLPECAKPRHLPAHDFVYRAKSVANDALGEFRNGFEN